MIHMFHQIQGFKNVATGTPGVPVTHGAGAGANKNKEDFHGIVSPISNSENSQMLLDKVSMFEPNQSWVNILLDFSLQILELVKPCHEQLTKECLYFHDVVKVVVC